jgi:tetratricopeptide (TPR) repeat protein
MRLKSRPRAVPKAAAHLALTQLPAKVQQANALHQRGQLEGARAIYEEVLKIQPRHFDALHLLGVIAAQSKDPQRAVDLIEKAIKINPHHAGTYCNRGTALQELGHSDAALASYDKAIALNPEYAVAYCNRGNVLKQLQRLDAAPASYDQAIANNAGYAEAYLNSGFVLKELQQLDEALASYSRAIAVKPDFTEAYFNRATTLLLRGKFEAGWRDYEWRWKMDRGSDVGREATPAAVRWSGDKALTGKTILLHGEQGLGDTLQFCRYATQIAALGANVILEVQAPLVSLLARLEGVSQVREKGTGRIGLAWCGNPDNVNDSRRSLLLADIVPSLPATFQYVSPQNQVRESDLHTLKSHPALLNFADELRDFSDLAALCACLDLVIKLYRQRRAGDWAGVIERIKTDLIQTLVRS